MSQQPVNTPDGWATVLTGPEEAVEALAHRIRSEGFRVQTRHSLDTWNELTLLRSGAPTELLVPLLAQAQVLALLKDWRLASPTSIDASPTVSEPEVVDPSEGSLRTLSLLYEAADELKHRPWNRRASESLAKVIDAVQATKPAYGIGDELWAQAARLGLRLQAAIREDRPFDVISREADAVCQLLGDRI